MVNGYAPKTLADALERARDAKPPHGENRPETENEP